MNVRNSREQIFEISKQRRFNSLKAVLDADPSVHHAEGRPELALSYVTHRKLAGYAGSGLSTIFGR